MDNTKRVEQSVRFVWGWRWETGEPFKSEYMSGFPQRLENLKK